MTSLPTVEYRSHGRRGVPATVVIRETDLNDLRDELKAVVAETRDYAERVMQIGAELAGGSMSRQMVMNLGGELVYRSARRIAQLGSVTL